MKAIIAALALLCAQPAAAQGVFANDYELIFEQNAAQIERRVAEDGATIEEIALEGGVTVQRRLNADKPVYLSFDRSETGAVGCVMGILMQFQKTAEACPAKVSEEQKKRLSSALVRVGVFYAQNRVPKIAEGQMITEIARQGKIGGSCSQLEDPDYREFFDGVLTDDLTQTLDLLLAVPRLPVVNPCL